MNAWTDEELKKISESDELHIQSRKQDGTLRNPVTIWLVRVENDLYIRAVKGPDGLWYRHATATHQGHINAGGIDKDVTFEEVDKNINEKIDEAYQTKYNKYGAQYVDSTLTQQAKDATLKVVPRSTS